MLIMLDSDGIVVGALDFTEPPDTILVTDDGTFEYEDRQGDDYIYRQVES